MSETTPDKGPLEQQMTVQADGTVTCLSKDWFYQPGEKDNFYTVRTSHVQPLICGAETMPRILQVLQSAEKSIDIGVWCFDPALSLNGYDPKLNFVFGLFDSLRYPFNDSPRIGDILLDAACRGVKIRITVWTLGDLVYNPFHWRVLASRLDEIFARLKEHDGKKYWEMIKEYFDIDEKDIAIAVAKVLGVIIFICIAIYIFRGKAVSEIVSFIRDVIIEFAKNNINFISNFGYRAIWYEELKRFPNIEIRTIGDEITPEMIDEFLNSIFRCNEDEKFDTGYYDENGFLEKKYVHILLKEKFKTHHQKCIIVDYEKPDAVGFVMGNNLKMVDFDSLEHPEDAGTPGGRFPGEVPRQDIASFITGDVLEDIKRNYDRIWADGTPSPSCVSGGAGIIPSWIKDIIEKYKDFVRSFVDFSQSILGIFDSLGLGSSDALQSGSGVPALWQELPKGNCQLSTTLIRHERGESYIAKAYRRALDCCTSFVYFENQYFRYDTLAKALAQRAKTRFAAKENQRGDPLYFFVVVNDVESFAFSTTYPVMETLGHAGQMPAEEHSRYQELWDDKEKLSELEDEESRAQLEKVKTEMAELERYYPQLKCGEEPKEPRKALAIEKANEAFTLNEDPSLKGHIAVLLICKETTIIDIAKYLASSLMNGDIDLDDAALLKKNFWDWRLDPYTPYTYEPVNVHTKTMIVDDVFIIIGSANMHQRGMEYDNEIDISTTRPGAARDTRRTLFAAYTENDKDIMNEQASWKKVHDGWKKLLDKNWRRHFKWKKLQGMLFYFYNPSVSSKIVTLD